MELEDSLFPLLREVSIGVEAMQVFRDADWALLIGAKPRGPGMERSDLLEINGQIFADQVRGAILQTVLCLMGLGIGSLEWRCVFQLNQLNHKSTSGLKCFPQETSSRHSHSYESTSSWRAPVRASSEVSAY